MTTSTHFLFGAGRGAEAPLYHLQEKEAADSGLFGLAES
jgi:hypothetical protein